MAAPSADHALPLAAGPRIEPRAKLRHLLHTWVFCVAIAVLLVAFVPERDLLPALAHSLPIGTICWAVVDLGRHFFRSARETGWPDLLPGLALVVVAILAAYLGGTAAGDALCRLFGWDTGHVLLDPAAETRTALLVTLVAGAIGSYYFYSLNRGQYLERKAAEAQRLADEARLKLLETQLEPHMLFNTLANLRALIAVDPPRAQQMLDHMIAYLRATLDASRGTTHPLQAEFDRVRDYLEVMKIRMGARLSYALDLPPELAHWPVPTLLLQPLVENAIQHGLEPQVQGGRLTVSARSQQDGRLLLEVLDTGAGPGESTSGSGFGLAQVRQRLATLHGPAAQLAFQPVQPHGARAAITLPAGTA